MKPGQSIVGDGLVPSLEGTVNGFLLSGGRSVPAFVQPTKAAILALTCSIFLSLTHFIFALEIPEHPEGYVSDYAQLLSPSAKARLEEKLRHFEDETTHQIAVVTFPGLEGEALEDFSIRLAEKWKIGQKAKDNGAILLVFKEDRAVRIEVGYGLEGALTDAASKLIIENEIIPRFREGKFDEGIERAMDAIQQATRGEYQPVPRQASPGYEFLLIASLIVWFQMTAAPVVLAWGWLVLGIVSFLVAFIFNVPGALIPILFIFGVPLLLYFLLGGNFRRGVLISREGFDGGGTYRSTRGWGGGGFSGGGGSFGGGGASGRW